MFTTELIVTQGTSGFSLDLTQDIPMSLNMSIADIREPERRNGSFSKTIKLKGTKTNNKFFEHTYQVNVATNSWNANLKTPCYILQDGSVVFEGYLRLLQINVVLVNGVNDIEYEVAIFADNNSLFAAIGDSKLEDLDLSEFNHVYSRANIINSWGTSIVQNGSTIPFSLGTGYFYPLIDYGYNNFATNSFPVETWRPAFYEKAYIDKIFSTAGKTYTSTFFNSQFFKRQFIPHCGDKFSMSAANLAPKEFYAGDTGGASAQNHTLTYANTTVGHWHGVFSSVVGANTLDCKFNDDSTNPFSDPGLQYDTSTGIITVASNGNYNISAVINWQTKVNAPVGTVTIVSPSNTPTTYYLLKSTDGGVTYTIANSQFINHSGVTYSASYTSLSYTMNVPTAAYYAGEKYKIAVRLFINSTTSGIKFLDAGSSVLSGTATLDSRLRSTATLSFKLATPNYTAGQTLTINDAIPRDVKQRDFLTSIFKKYNLYVDVDKDNPNNYLIETRNDFYAAGSTKNWSAKLAWDKPINIRPMSELDWKTLIYRYKADNDYYNKQYFDRYQEPYGSYKKVITNDFVSREVKNELIFSPTPVVDNPNNSLIIPKIFDYDGTVVKPMKHNIRSLMYNGIVLPMSSGTYDFPSPVSDIYGGTVVSLATYPECGMVGQGTWGIITTPSPLAPTDSIEFGIPNEVYYSLGTNYTTNNLFNRFYSRQVNEITDRDAKIVTAWLYLEPKDIAEFDFRDTIFLDQEDSGAYYYVNKIMDYNPLENELTKVEFVKIKTYDDYVATTVAVAIAETGIGGTGMSSNRFGTSGDTTTEVGAGNNVMVGDNISSRSAGGFYSGRNISVDVGTERIDMVTCQDVVVFNGVTGFTGMNCSGVYVGASSHDITLINCTGVNINDFVYGYTGINVHNKTVTVLDNNSIEFGQFTTNKITSGVYTPTLTIIANIDTVTAYECTYARIANEVVVSGKLDLNPTATATVTTLDISLPIASTFTSTSHCAGTASAPAVAGMSAAINGAGNLTKARLSFISSDIAERAMAFSFTYKIE